MSVGGELARKKAMWLYPKVLGFNPSERWGHSACYSNGAVYAFGGCCGGLHFSDVLVLNLDSMAWSTLATVGHGPGPRDSHSAVIVGHRMIVFGGTNGSRKVNDLHVLDLGSKEWTQPECRGSPPSPRESHTATLIGDEKLVIFGGSGEGEGNYLNDFHILDLKTMQWTSPEVKGNVPVPRDSHSAVAIGDKLFVYGGDCGDRYHGNVDMFDMDTLTWSRLAVQGSSPGVRAGHAAVSIGTKVYIIGGVGDKHYYNDIWVLDISSCSWTQLEIRGQQPQGRFSHTAIVADSDIVIYGGCGEDERPLNELLVLQLGAEHPNGRYNISLCKIFGNHLNHGKRRLSAESENCSKIMVLGRNGASRKGAHDPELELKHSFRFSSDTLHPKRRRTSNSKQRQIPINCQSKNTTNSQTNHGIVRRTSQDFQSLGEHPKKLNPDQFLHVSQADGQESQHPASKVPIQNLIGAEIRGKVDGVFDSGYLMTAMVNGKLFRGVLFAPGPGIVLRGAAPAQNISSPTNAQPFPKLNNGCPTILRPSQQQVPLSVAESSHSFRRAQVTHSSQMVGASPSLDRESSLGSDLQGVVLTLGGPGSGQNHK
ncbi:uncharacterized protein LOC131154292 isoform X2 [Malania oleifera]|uniref:uncharacterized protein LOC131154292 isoform X2 n=1 Tax=Malania oleifera TaxID=397392 RepID=UPI0025AE001C|nr:uncharacterized protein LOC131154292 isoform X2 [Malania oleifera]